MDFIPRKEKVLISKYLNAQNIRSSIRTGHFLREVNKVNVRESLEKASERISVLEKSLRDIWEIREKKARLKQAFETSIKLQRSMIIKEQVKRSAILQEKKLSGSYLKDKLFLNGSISPSHVLPSLSNQKITASKTPYHNRGKKFYSVGHLKGNSRNS